MKDHGVPQALKNELASTPDPIDQLLSGGQADR